MKLAFLVTLITVGFAFHANADNIEIQSDAAAKSWEQCSNGIAVALTLTVRKENDQVGAVHVFIKNTSQSDKYVAGFEAGSRLQLSYTAGGVQVPLRKYTYPLGVVDANGAAFVLKPGKILARTIDLTSTELAIVKSHPVACSFLISDQEATAGYKIETTPKMLSIGP